MNRLRTQQKIKPKTTSIPDTNSVTSGGGFLNKLTKRYSNVSAKILRKSSGRKSDSLQPIGITGSYDMTGHRSDDHRIEIGAPILISKTSLDCDRFNYGTPVQNAGITAPNSCHNSSSSENEVYVDAVSSIPSVRGIKFQFHSQMEDEKELNAMKSSTNDIYQTPNLLENIVGDPNEAQKAPLRKNRWKSVQNLHESEMKVFLESVMPSSKLVFRQKFQTTADLENCYDLPSSDAVNRRLNWSDDDANPDGSLRSSDRVKAAQTMSHSVPNSPNCPDINENLNNLNHTIKCAESLDTIDNFCKTVPFSSTIQKPSLASKPRDSVSLTNSLEDFDLKSVSFQSLNAQNLFMSIEELNEITRQINESEDFGNIIDLEYCDHRDNLKPSERRITLLKNKNSRLINFEHKREKINSAWSGLKNWIGEERIRLKEVVQKHPALEKVGVNSQTAPGSGSGHKNGYAVGGNGVENECGSAENSLQNLTNENDRTINSLDASSSSHNSEAMSKSVQTVVGNISGGDKGAYAANGSTVSDAESSFKRNLREITPQLKIINNKEKFEGQNGFEELRRYVKQGGDFGKDLMAILQERVESEQLYAKSLSKMASKLSKACREIPGSIAEAWRGAATEMEQRSEVHRKFSNSLIEEIVRPLKAIIDNQHKSRKAVESSVDKASRILSEWRASEAKSKKHSHTAARDNEKLQDAMLDVRIQRSPSIAVLHRDQSSTMKLPTSSGAEKEIKNAEKDCAKLDNKRRKAEEAVKRADVEYYTLCIRAERARVDWEMSVLRGSTVLQSLENQRLTNMKTYVSAYLRMTSDMNPILSGLVERLQPQIESCNVQKDLTVVKNIRRASEGPSEQLLPDFYCEHTTLAMNRERRKHALVKLLQLVRTDLERERRSRNGLNGLSQSLNTQDNQNITDKLYHIRSMLTYLEGARFKLQSALLELDHKPRSSHPLASHIQITRDRTGLQQSILKVPLWLKNDDKMNGVGELKDYPHSSQTDSATDSSHQANDGGSCLNIKNNISIKHFDRNFNRSRSEIEIDSLNSVQTITAANAGRVVGKSENLLVADRSPDNPGFDRGIADGGSNQPDSDFDEFSSQDEEDEPSIALSRKTRLASLNSVSDLRDEENLFSSASKKHQPPAVILSHCKALYSYTPKLYDELELNPGDIIEVHAKQEDGWWLGALKNQIGIFPATYVEEIV